MAGSVQLVGTILRSTNARREMETLRDQLEVNALLVRELGDRLVLGANK